MASNLSPRKRIQFFKKPTLRAKAILTGLLIAFAISLITSLFTYQIAKRYLTSQRVNIATSQISIASRLVARSMIDGNSPLESLLSTSGSFPNSQTAIRANGEWFISKAGFDINLLPLSMVDLVASGTPVRTQILLGATPVIAVGIPISINDSSNFVFFGTIEIIELQRTLNLLQNIFIVGSIFSTIGGAFIGLWLSRRVSEPLKQVSSAAERIALGDFSIQIDIPTEPDLSIIAKSFNFMTKSLQTRIAREARFGAVVSHELRSPLTAIRGATDLLDGMQSELPPRAGFSVNILRERVISFEKILNDLIEISRYESGTVHPNLESLPVQKMIEALCKRSSELHLVFVDQTESGSSFAQVDTKRFQQIFENLVSNARAYADGISTIRIEESTNEVLIHFDDSGIGVPDDTQATIFEPFVRGVHHSAKPGSGLGLTISTEHAHIMGGNLTVSTSPEGGARFTVSLKRTVDFS
jgi:two-component system, OmpR family, sensor histidine kinase MtrB